MTELDCQEDELYGEARGDELSSRSASWGRRKWFRVAHRELEEHRASEAAPVPRDWGDRLFQALGRFEENHQMDLATNGAIAP